MNDDEKELLKVGAETAMKPFADLINKLFGGPVEQIGGMWTDGLVARRQIRQLKLIKKVKKAVDEAGFDPCTVRDSVAVPLLQAALLEDEETLQDKWANLLANAADPRAPGFVEPSFPTILKDLTSREVRFLDAFVARVLSEGGGHTFSNADVECLEFNLREVFDRAGLSAVPIAAQPNSPGGIRDEYMVETDRTSYYLCLDTLLRNRLIEKHVRTHFHDALNATSGQAYETYSLTALGRNLVRACQPPPQGV